MTERRTVGVLGGMGPAATHAFFGHLIRLTDAASDHDHLHIVIDNNPLIEDRTAFLLGHGADPRPGLVASARRLRAAGADLLVMPCNTAAAFSPDIEAAVGVPLVDWVGIAAQEAAQQARSLVGVLATTGTRKAGLYDDALARFGRSIVHPAADAQDAVMDVVYGEQGIKAGAHSERNATLLLDAASTVADAGAEVIVLGCTELPLAVASGDPRWPVPVIDPSVLVAHAVIESAGGTVRSRTSP